MCGRLSHAAAQDPRRNCQCIQIYIVYVHKIMYVNLYWARRIRGCPAGSTCCPTRSTCRATDADAAAEAEGGGRCTTRPTCRATEAAAAAGPSSEAEEVGCHAAPPGTAVSRWHWKGREGSSGDGSGRRAGCGCPGSLQWATLGVEDWPCLLTFCWMKKGQTNARWPDVGRHWN